MGSKQHNYQKYFAYSYQNYIYPVSVVRLWLMLKNVRNISRPYATYDYDRDGDLG